MSGKLLCMLHLIVCLWMDGSRGGGTCRHPDIPEGCSCSSHANHSLNVWCERLGLTTLPSLDLGFTTVHTFSLKRNNLTQIRTGDFFGLKVSRLVLRNNAISSLPLLAFWGLEYHLDNLDLGGNSLTSIPTDALRLLRNLRTLNLEGNLIKTLVDGGLSALDRLEVLTLDKNPLTIIEPNAFKGTALLLLSLNHMNFSSGLSFVPSKDLDKLRGLSLSDSQLHTIPKGWFQTLRCLKSLTLDHNKFQVFSMSSFTGVYTTLKTLELNYNKIKKIPKQLLRKFTALESLELSHNRIRKIHSRSFNASRCLFSLDLRYNYIRDISRIAFEGMMKVEIIDLRGNNLITLEKDTLTWPGSKLREIYLSENSWLCNCLLKWMKSNYKSESSSVVSVIADMTSLRCARPDKLSGRPIVRIPIRDFTCDNDYYYYYYDYSDNG